MPGDEALPVIEELADRIAACENTKFADLPDGSHKMDYQGLKEKIKSQVLFREKMAHRHGFPSVVQSQNPTASIQDISLKHKEKWVRRLLS